MYHRSQSVQQAVQPEQGMQSDQSSLVDPARVYKTPATPSDKPYMVEIPVSRQASRDAILAMECNPQGFTTGEWYVWYVSEEIGTDLFQQHFQHIKPPSEDLIQAIADVDDNYPFGPDSGIIDKFTPEMTKNPLYQPSAATARPSEPEFSPFWINPACQDLPDYAIVHKRDNMVAGLVAEVPGKAWKYMTGHLTRLQSPNSKPYFEKIEYVKVPAFWSRIITAHQLQHALASVSDKMVSQDWVNSDPKDFPSELNQTFDTSLLTPTEGVPDGNASAIAVVSYVVCTLQVMICEPSMFKNNLRWYQKCQS